MQCVDITFTSNMSLVQPVGEDNCYNDSSVQFGTVFSTSSLSSATAIRVPQFVGVLGTAVVAAGMWLLL